jgi:hypothetical protein
VRGETRTLADALKLDDPRRSPAARYAGTNRRRDQGAFAGAGVVFVAGAGVSEMPLFDRIARRFAW